MKTEKRGTKMQSKNNITRMLTIICISILVIGWGSMASLAQSGMNQESQMNKMGSEDISHVNSYILYIPVTSKAGTCQDIRNQLSATMGGQPGADMKHDPGGSSAMTSIKGVGEWGCASDGKALYLFTRASSEEAAMDQVPTDLRDQARVISLSSISGSMPQEQKMDHGMNSKSSEVKGLSYLVYIPGNSQANTCQDIMNEFSSTMNGQSGKDMKPDPAGSVSMTRNRGAWEWGCSSDNKALYLFTKASGEKAALDEVPTNLRKQATVIRMSSLSEQKMHGQKMDQGGKSSRESNY
jgi:hypothetical protein